MNGAALPRIGITSSEANAKDGSLHPDVVPYVDAVVRAGGEPVLLLNDVTAVGDVLAGLDGVVLSGGVDVDPSRYGGKALHSLAQTGRYRADRDAFEIALARMAREREVPVLCICRGIQVANVAFGGTLVEDVRDELGAGYTINHRQTYENGQDRADYAPGHMVTVDAGSALAALLGTASFATNSMHHQALRTLGEGFEAVARTSDGVVEAFEMRVHPFFFGVQWHPEELGDDPVSERLFSGLTRSANERRR